MNPYTPPIASFPELPQRERVAIKNPARFLLYPLGSICIFFSLAMGWYFLSNGFKFRTADFLNAGIGLLEVLFAISAFVLAARKLSKKTRLLTIVWSLGAVSMLVIGVFFNLPASIQDFINILLTGSILLLVGFLAIRHVPEEVACE